MRFRYCLIPSLEPNYPKGFLYFRAIQGHSRGTLVDPTLQDKCTDSRGLRRVHLPHRERDRHAFYYQQWTDSRWKASQKRERQCVFFTAVNPMDEHRFPENARYDLDKARIVADKNEWTVHQNAVFLVQPEVCSQERNCSSIKPYLRFGLRKWCTGKLEKNYMPQTTNPPRRPRVVLKSNPQYQGRHDLPQKDVGQSAEQQGKEHVSHGETHGGTVDYRIQGVPQSAVRKEYENRTEIVKS